MLRSPTLDGEQQHRWHWIGFNGLEFIHFIEINRINDQPTSVFHAPTVGFAPDCDSRMVVHAPAFFGAFVVEWDAEQRWKRGEIGDFLEAERAIK